MPKYTATYTASVTIERELESTNEDDANDEAVKLKDDPETQRQLIELADEGDFNVELDELLEAELKASQD